AGGARGRDGRHGAARRERRPEGDRGVSRPLSRRSFFRRAGLIGGAALATGAAVPSVRPADSASGRPATGKAIMVGSDNALAGMNAAMHLLQSGSDPLGALLEAIHVVEDDPQDVTVGYGGI